jgi:hypothetical protein
MSIDDNSLNTHTTIHLDLDSLFIPKTDIDKITFGLYSYAINNNFPAPYIFTANVTTGDNTYLGVLKNNNIQLIESCKNASILFNKSWDKSAVHNLLITQNMPHFTSEEVTRGCIYIDWDNIQVSAEYIEAFIKGAQDFIDNTKVHTVYKIYVFLHSKNTTSIKQIFKDLGVEIVLIIKDKSGCGDEEILDYIRKNTITGDSVCIASGDRDFSSLMVDYVRKKINVFLIYNNQALYTFKHNVHWLSSIDIKNIKGVDSKPQEPKIQKNNKTKPCKFYNLDICNAVNCNFIHICGVCGRPHKMRDFHPKISSLKNTICKKYNLGTCVYNHLECNFLHVCIKCKKPHPYLDCEFIMLHCPLCNCTVSNIKEYIHHQIDPTHQSRVEKLKQIYPKKFYSA